MILSASDFLLVAIVSMIDPIRWVPLGVAAFNVRTVRGALIATVVIALAVEIVRFGLAGTAERALPPEMASAGLLSTFLLAAAIFSIRFWLLQRAERQNG